MSSELAGDLGQVGLVGELKEDSQEGDPLYPGKQEVEEVIEMKRVVLEEVAQAGGQKRAYLREGGRVSNNRPKKFRQAWMMYDIFKEWLRPHPLPEFATCIACNRVIKAGKSELEKHAVGKKHLRMLKNITTRASEGSTQDFCTSRTSLFDESGFSGPESKEIEICSDQQDLCVEGVSQERVIVQQEQSVGINSSPSISSGVSLNFSSSPLSPANSFPAVTSQPVMNNQNNRPADGQYVSKAFVTKPAPSWKATAIVNGHVTRLDLSDYKGRYLILFFYPQDFSKLCASEVNILSDRINEFRANCTEVVACSVDSHLSHLAWSKTSRSEGGIGLPKIPIIADPTHTIAKDYGVFMPEKGHALRAHFIIDRRGILRHMAVNDVGVGRGTDELMRIVKALQYIDENEGVCMADWKPSE